jgi:hypothetical protein
LDCLASNGVITFRRYALPNQFEPRWSESSKGLAPMHLTTAKRIEDIDCVLQVNWLILLQFSYEFF